MEPRPKAAPTEPASATIARRDADDSATLSQGPPPPPDGATEPGGEAPLAADAASGLRLADRGQFVIEREHARGGLGRVMLARDPSLDRSVALKEVLRRDPATVARFVREARITARLGHPNIVPVYEAGRWPSGEPFYAMRFISGRSLGAVVKETHALDARLSLVPNLVAVADAVAYAHSVGVIHRDLKPDNVLVGAFGETVVIDWGLAKDLAAGEDEALAFGGPTPGAPGALTVAGARVGTPAYMAPEQARGEVVDERADVWALGAMMFTVLTGEPPFKGPSAETTLALAASAAPPDIEERAPGVPRDLATIVRKAMAARPADRYPTARELADDLRRFQTGQLVSARRYSRLTLIGRWLRRHRVAVAIAGLSLAALAVTLTASVQRVVREKTRAEARTGELILAQAKLSLDHDPTAAIAWLKSYPAEAPGWIDARIAADDARARGVARHVLALPDGVGDPSELAFDDAGHLTGLAENRIVRWDATTGALLSSAVADGSRPSTLLPGGAGILLAGSDGGVDLLPPAGGAARRIDVPAGAAGTLVVSADGRFLAAAGEGSLVVASIHGAERRVLVPPPSAVLTLSLSPDGAYLAAGTDDRTAVIWEVASGRETRLEGALAKPAPLVFFAGGSRLAAAGDDGAIRVWDVATRAARSLRGHGREAAAIAASPDGSRLASVDAAGEMRLWDVASGEGRVIPAHRGHILALRFSPDGSLLASTGQDETLHLLAVATGESRVLHGHTGVERAMAFSPDSRRIATSGGDQVRVWDALPPPGRTLRDHEARVTHAVFSPDGSLLATCSGHDVVIWDVATGRLLRRGQHEAEAYGVAFSPDGRFVASASSDATARIWETRGAGERVLRGHDGRVRDVAYSPDGAWIATGGRDGTVRIWDAASGASRLLVKHASQVSRVLFSPDGRAVASLGFDRAAWLADVAGGPPRRLGQVAGVPYQMGFLDGGARLVVASNDEAKSWDLATGREQIVPHVAHATGRLTVSDDGGVIAFPAGERVVIFEPARGTLRELRGHDRPIQRCRLSPDGRRLVSASYDGAVRVWDLATGAARTVHRHEGVVFDVGFSPDGRLVASAGLDRTAWIGPASEAGEDVLLPDPASVRPALGRWTTAVVGADNHARTP